MELATGVHAFDLTLSRDDRETTFHSGAVETDRGLVLLDVGFPDTLEQLASHLDRIGYGWPDVWAVLLTHQDGDHVGGLAEVVERADPVRFAHPACAPFVDGRQEPIKGGGDRYPPVSIDVEVADGSTIDTVAGPLRLLHTPGHAPGHLACYLPDEKLLFAGDALTAPEGELAGPKEQYTPNLPEAIESVGRLAEYDIERTLCYHGGLVEKGTGMIARVWQELAEAD